MRTKNDFPKDKNGRTILANAEDMREWVELGFEEQRENRSSDVPFPQDVINLMGWMIRGRFFDPFLIKGLKYPVRNKSH